jgi:MFS family permease
MLVGVSEAALVPAAVSMIADSFAPQRRGTAVGLFAMGTAIGGPLGITIGGALLVAVNSPAFSALPIIGALESWRAVLVVMGVAGLVAPLLLLTLNEPQRHAAERDATWRVAMQYVLTQWRVLLPLYLGMGLLSIGDYGLVSWVPTALSRQFGWTADRVGVAFGLITATAGIAGSLCGGWCSDLGARHAGQRGRALLSIVAAVCATGAALAISGGLPSLVLVGLGLWVFASTTAAIGAVALLQEIVPNHLRGTGVSILTFCNTLLGLGCGPTLVALTTDHVYRAPEAVGMAISTVVVPAGVSAVIAFVLCRRQLGKGVLAARSAAGPEASPI